MAHVLGKLNYALRADEETVALIKAQAVEPSSALVQRGGSGAQGAGRFFTDPREVLVQDARPLAESLNIDQHGQFDPPSPAL
jgi:hypothetical protein